MKKTISLILWLVLSAQPCLADPQDIITLATAEIGNGEIGKNNAGKYVKRYNQGLEAAWCAGFVSYILKQANFTGLDYSLSTKAIYNQAKEKNRVTLTPKVGYLIVFWRDNPKSWKGHVGIISKIDDTFLYSVEGNKRAFPSRVKEFKYNKNNIPQLLGYIKTD